MLIIDRQEETGEGKKGATGISKERVTVAMVKMDTNGQKSDGQRQEMQNIV